MNKKCFKVLAGLGFVHLALLSANAFSQEKINQLDEVVVTASRSPRKQSEIGKVVRVISSAQLAQSQGRTLPELLNNVAGLTIGGGGSHPADLQSVYLRGASTGNTLILIDGLPVNNASTISGEFDIATIAIDQIERVEILKGGNSTLYGSDAVAGVINIITKKGEGELNAELLASAGSYQTYKEALSVNGNLGKTRLALNASNLNSKGFSTATSNNGNAGLDKDGYKQQGLNLTVQQQLSEKFKLHAQVQASKNYADLDGGAFTDLSGDFYNKKSNLLGLGAQYIAGQAVIDLNISQNNVDTRFLNFGEPSHTIGRITNLDANLSVPLADFVDLISGFSYKYSATKQYSNYGDLDADNNLSSAFSSFFFKLGDQFRTELGGRFNHHNVYGNNLTYTFNPSYVIANRYKLFVNLSSAYKVPSLYQLFSEYGNLGLKPESTETFELGADMELLPNKLRLNAAYFSRNIQDVIDFVPGGPSGYIYENQSQQKDHGFELELGYKPNAKLSIDAFYAFVNGKLFKVDEVEHNLYRRPKHSAGFTGRAQLNTKLSASLIYKWVGKRQDQYYDAMLDETLTVDLRSHSVLDAYLQYQPKKNITLFMDVKNLLDTDYIDVIGYTTRGINFNAGFKLGLL